jgi:hypothetical protein
VRDQIKLLQEAGFTDAVCAGMTGFNTSPYTAGALFTARKPDNG